MNTQEQVKQHLADAYDYYDVEEPDKALRACDAAIELAPNMAEAHNLRGMVLEDLGRLQEATAAYETALQIDPEFEEGRENLAVLEMKQSAPVAEFTQIDTPALFTMVIIGLGIGGLFFIFQGIAAWEVNPAGMAIFITIGVGMLVLAARGMIRSARDRGLQVKVCSSGLSREVQGAEREVVVWEDIGKVWQSVTSWQSYGAEVARSYEYTIELKDGRQFEFYNLENIPELGQIIQRHVTQRQLPVIHAKLATGEPVSFGKVTVHPEGLSKGGNVLPWDQIQQVEVKKGEVIIHRGTGTRRYPWVKIQVSKIPNIFIFLTLLREKQHGAQEKKQ